MLFFRVIVNVSLKLCIILFYPPIGLVLLLFWTFRRLCPPFLFGMVFIFVQRQANVFWDIYKAAQVSSFTS